MDIKVKDDKIIIKTEGQEIILEDCTINELEFKDGKLKKISFKPQRNYIPFYPGSSPWYPSPIGSGSDTSKSPDLYTITYSSANTDSPVFNPTVTANAVYIGSNLIESNN